MKPDANRDWRDTLGALLPPDYTTDDTTQKTAPESDTTATPQKLRIDIERKGRAGKTATIISGFTLDDDEINDIAARLKKRLGTGGSARGAEILIQGDRRDDVARVLREFGLIK